MKHLLLFCCLFCGLVQNAQVKFCPSGAKWTGLHSNNIWSQGTGSSSIVYERDSIEGTDTLKVLKHQKFYKECNVSSLYSPLYTLLKQRGDTIFMRNRFTKNNWEILFNYNCAPGQSWTTTYTLTNLPASRTYTIMVDSVSVVQENNISLRKLSVTVTYLYYQNTYSFQTSIYERYGWGFLFFYKNNSGGCDGDYFHGSLCYSDDVFGTKYFSSRPCDFQNPSGLNEGLGNDVLNVSPNPFRDLVTINIADEEGFLRITDINGRLILRTELKSPTEIDLSGLEPGIYFLHYYSARTIGRKKLFKVEY